MIIKVYFLLSQLTYCVRNITSDRIVCERATPHLNFANLLLRVLKANSSICDSLQTTCSGCGISRTIMNEIWMSNTIRISTYRSSSKTFKPISTNEARLETYGRTALSTVYYTFSSDEDNGLLSHLWLDHIDTVDLTFIHLSLLYVSYCPIDLVNS